MKGNQEDLLRYLKQLQNWSGYLSRRSKQVEEVIKALQSVNMAMLDKGVLKELISALASLDQARQQQTQKETSAGKKTKNQAVTFASNDELIQLMNSPAMNEIIKEVFKNKRKW